MCQIQSSQRIRCKCACGRTGPLSACKAQRQMWDLGTDTGMSTAAPKPGEEVRKHLLARVPVLVGAVTHLRDACLKNYRLRLTNHLPQDRWGVESRMLRIEGTLAFVTREWVRSTVMHFGKSDEGDCPRARGPALRCWLYYFPAVCPELAT